MDVLHFGKTKSQDKDWDTHNWAAIHNWCLWKTRNAIAFSTQAKDLSVWALNDIDRLLAQTRAEATLRELLKVEELKYIRIKLNNCQ